VSGWDIFVASAAEVVVLVLAFLAGVLYARKHPNVRSRHFVIHVERESKGDEGGG
jgi:hypothetical protein